jgi:hypothetical protein
MEAETLISRALKNRSAYQVSHEGKLFVIRGTDGANVPGFTQDAGPIGNARTLHHFRLCDSCCKAMVVTPDPQNRVKVMSVSKGVIVQSS